MILNVQITEMTSGTSRSLRFPKSPVRIGRNQLNDIPLEDPFVSEWHGIIRFDDRSIAYFDLGSTNGTVLDGKRLAKNVGVELTMSSRLQLGRLEMVASLQKSTDSGAGFNQTKGWNPADVTPGNPAPPVIRAPSRVDAPSSPIPAMGAAQTPVPRDNQMAAQLTQYRTLLEAFSEAFVGLRKGYEQFGAEVGIRTVTGTTALHRAHNSREVMDYLLQPGMDPGLAARELIAMFADLGIHHIAMMEGITEGVRAVLQSLDPRANDLDAAGPRLFASGKTKSQWKKYLERFDQIVTDDNELHATIFSDEFARAYASVTLGEDDSDRHPPEKPGRKGGR
jgi:predicted component of type VI protein secretion system